MFLWTHSSKRLIHSPGDILYSRKQRTNVYCSVHQTIQGRQQWTECNILFHHISFENLNCITFNMTEKNCNHVNKCYFISVMHTMNKTDLKTDMIVIEHMINVGLFHWLAMYHTRKFGFPCKHTSHWFI